MIGGIRQPYPIEGKEKVKLKFKKRDVIVKIFDTITLRWVVYRLIIQYYLFYIMVGWGKIAEIAEKYTAKGSEIGVSGKLIYRTYDDKNGDKKTITEVQINELLLLGKA